MAVKTPVKILFAILFFLCLLVIGLLVAEIAYTISGKYPIEGIEYSSTEIWHWRKNLHMNSWDSERGNYPLHTDKNGFRNYGKNYDSDTNVIRILIIGDSYTIGLSYPDNEIFTGILEKKLNEYQISKKKIEVFNMAAPAWGTEQQFLCFKNYGLKINPDYVLLMTCPNDIRETYCKGFAKLESGEVKFNPLPFNSKEILRWKFANYSCFYKYLQKEVFYTHFGTFEMLMDKYRFNFGKEDQTNWDRPMFLKQTFPELDEAYMLYYKIVSDLKYLCDDHQIHFAVSSTPFLMEFDEAMKKDTTMQPGIVTERIHSFCTAQRIPYVNLYERFKSSDAPIRFFRAGDSHFNSIGHEETANALADHFRKIIR